MPEYRCVVSDESGHTSVVMRSGDREDEIIRSFMGESRWLVSMELVHEKKKKRKRRSAQAVGEFTEMMGLLVESGLSLKDALELNASINKNAPGGEIAETLLEKVRKGASFAQAVDHEESSFPDVYRGMVRIGDRVGSVEKILPRLSAYLADQKSLKDKLSGALAYPMLVLTVSVAGILGLLLFVMPRMEQVFAGFGGEAAEKIRGNMETLKFVFIGLAAFIGGLIFAIILLMILRGRNKGLRITLDRWLLRVPGIGTFVSALETLNFAFAMETLSSGGIPVESALEEALAVVGNSAYREAIAAVRADVLKGQPLSSAFANRSEFPVYVSRWLAVGEKSGQSERVFAQIRVYFQKEVERKSGRFMALIEPALIILIGIVLIALVIVGIVPIFSMYGSIL